MPAGKLSILIVDRDKSVAETLVMVLRSGGFDAVATFSGEEALLKAAQSRFDVLLTDVMMEPMNGIETALAFLQVQPAARVLLFSGSNDSVPILSEAAQAGHSFHVLAKPVHPTELFACLNRGTSDPNPALPTLPEASRMLGALPDPPDDTKLGPD